MMENNGSYHYWGMHLGWWVLMLIAVIAIGGWINWSRKRK